MRASDMPEQSSREAKYRELLGKAEQVVTSEPVVILPGIPADAYFPWELSQFHANGSTSAEKPK